MENIANVLGGRKFMVLKMKVSSGLTSTGGRDLHSDQHPDQDLDQNRDRGRGSEQVCTTLCSSTCLPTCSPGCSPSAHLASDQGERWSQTDKTNQRPSRGRGRGRVTHVRNSVNWEGAGRGRVPPRAGVPVS